MPGGTCTPFSGTYTELGTLAKNPAFICYLGTIVTQNRSFSLFLRDYKGYSNQNLRSNFIVTKTLRSLFKNLNPKPQTLNP